MKRKSDTAFDVMSSIIFALAIIVSLYPLIWMVLNSFRSNDQLFQHPMQLPQKFDFSVFKSAWVSGDFKYAVLNSVIVTFCTVVLNLSFSSLAAFALARMKFPGRKFLNRLFTSSIIISGQVILIPLFFIIKGLGLYDQLPAVILAGTAMGLPISIVLLNGFFQGIPIEIEESTLVDGCHRFQFFYQFVLPLSKPIIATVVIFQSMWTWNEYLYALTFLKSEPVRTIPLELSSFFTMFKTEWNEVFAALSIAVVPLLIVYVILQKQFIKGLTAGAVKM